MSTRWTRSDADEGIYEGRDRNTMELKWTATPVDLVFGSSAELRAIAEAYAANDAEKKFIGDFVKAWSKVMTLDRFDVDYSEQNIALERIEGNGANNTAP
jgi:catalase-peroxidase